MNENSKIQRYIDGMKAGIPVILGFVPVGIAYGVMARNAGFSLAQTVSMSLIVFAGASQFMAVGMYSQGAALLAIVFATLILNFRHFIMGTVVMNRMKGVPLWKKLIASFGITDESFAIYSTMDEKKCSVEFFFGLITVCYSSWFIGSLIGGVATDFLPDIITASLGISLYAMFLGLIVPSLPGNPRLALLVVIAAVCNTVLSRFMDSSWAMIATTLICAFIGVYLVDDKAGEASEKEGGQ